MAGASLSNSPSKLNISQREIVIFQKCLRLSQTNAESYLWHRLRNRNFNGYKFRRQHIIQKFIVDFVCLEKKLIIEIDGGQHAEQFNYDQERSLKLKNDGFRIIRFWNNDVFTNTEAILETIYQALNSPSPAAYPV